MAEYLKFACSNCGKTIILLMDHYDKGYCGHCRYIYWALQPRKDGPLVAFPWPGTPEMLRYKQQIHQVPA